MMTTEFGRAVEHRLSIGYDVFDISVGGTPSDGARIRISDLKSLSTVSLTAHGQHLVVP